MHLSTSFPSVQKTTSVLAALVVLPALVFCSIVPSAVATDKSYKVPEKAGAVFFNLETSKPSPAPVKASVDFGILGDSPTAVRVNEEGDVVVNEVDSAQPDLVTEDHVVRDTDMVILPQPLNRFTL